MLDDVGMTEKIAPDAEFTRFMSQLGESAKLHPSPWSHSWDGNGAPVGVAKRDLDAAEAESARIGRKDESARIGRKDDAGKLDWTLLPESLHGDYDDDSWEPTPANVVSGILGGDGGEVMIVGNRTGLRDVSVLEDVVRVLAFGANKYGRDNWRSVPDAVRRYRAAACRHYAAHCRGELSDQESGLPHIAHMLACILFLGCLLEDA